MNKNFADEFLKVQSKMVSLALEFAENNVDYIYIYIYNYNKNISFNAFFKLKNKLYTTNKMTKDKDLIRQFLKLGVDDVLELEKKCYEFNEPIPSELKIIYSAKENEFKGSYRYEEQMNAKETDSDLFMKWFYEEQENKN
ncbi:hypothetical protein JNUCC83_12405 (plasmid) [Vagococcus sp. JNUCC 83]